MTICAALAAALCTANADVKRASEKMTIDGRLDEPCWAAADWNGDFVRLASSVKDRSSRGAFWSRTTSGEPVSGHGTTPAWRPSVRWRGFNLLGMFCRTKMEDGDKRIFGYFPEDRFQWMEEWGFNFARSTTGLSSLLAKSAVTKATCRTRHISHGLKTRS